CRLDLLDPLRRRSALVEFGRLDQDHQVVAGLPHEVDDRCRSVTARLAGRHLEFEDALLGEQRQAASRRRDLIPVEPGGYDVNFTRAKAAPPRFRAYRVQGFLGEQGLVTTNQVTGQQGFCEGW